MIDIFTCCDVEEVVTVDDTIGELVSWVSNIILQETWYYWSPNCTTKHYLYDTCQMK